MGMRWTPKADGVLMPLKTGHEVDGVLMPLKSYKAAERSVHHCRGAKVPFDPSIL